MKVGDICNRLVICVDADESVHRAAEVMRKYHVGYLVVTEFGDSDRVPLGTLTDRDIVLEVTAPGIDPDEITVGDIMDQDPPLVADEQHELADTLEAMRQHGVRRIPVVDAKRKLVGVLALDDVLQLLGSQLSAITDIVSNQRRQESKVRA
ncbi:MAG TPA: CBS domain-containing protein [Gammaproteobacteria bacterium]|nr:CBS domain-containing protein [Gammaproteobacteria bacterium]